MRRRMRGWRGSRASGRIEGNGKTKLQSTSPLGGVILVTGGCGFTGANLVPRLIGAGARVRVIDDLSRGFRRYLDGLDVPVTVADIRDVAAVREAAEGADAIIHLAAFGSVVESVADPLPNFEMNALGTLSVLQAAREAGVERAIMASTGGAIMGDAPPR